MFLNYITLDDNLYKIYDENCEDLVVKEEEKDNRHIISLKAKKRIKLVEARLLTNYILNKDTKYFLNGYQSWTDTNLKTIKESEHNLDKAPKFLINAYGLYYYGDVSFYKYDKKKLHGFDILYSMGEKDNHFIINNNVKNAFLIIELLKKEKMICLCSDVSEIILEENQEFVLFDYYHYDNYQEGMNKFGQLFKVNSKKIFGYTSWYNYYQNINEQIILRDLDGMDKRFDLFQIDDGYETFVGDWLDIDKDKFPNGLKPIVDKIHQKGMKAGIWLAPLVAETKSKIYLEHQDWIKRDKDGNLASAGGNWSGFYALDLENKEVLNYIKKCLNYYMDLGFDFFKLDFLYASNLGYYEGKSRAQMTDYAYKMLRDILKDKLILGCGANMMSAYQRFDYMRVGPDMSLKYDDIWYMRFLHRERISSKVTMQNSITRSIFDGKFFGNDPDVFLLRDDNVSLTNEQKHSLVTINALFGTVFMASDNFNDYDDNKRKQLEEALELFYNAKVISYEKKGHNFVITYKLNDKEKVIVLNTKKGVLSNG